MPKDSSSQQQEPFEFFSQPSMLAEDFLVTEANSAAYAMVTGGIWQDGRLILCGPASSGKSHLADIWARRTGAPLHSIDEVLSSPVERFLGNAGLAIDDAHRVVPGIKRETALLHILNSALEGGKNVLLAAAEPPARWPVKLPDLRSRLLAASLASIGMPDDVLLKGLVIKLFADRRVAVPPAVVDYVLPRMERSFAEAARIVSEIDRRALAEGRNINRRLAADVLNGMFGR